MPGSKKADNPLHVPIPLIVLSVLVILAIIAIFVLNRPQEDQDNSYKGLTVPQNTEYQSPSYP